jgi:hypothetical protein
VTDGDYPSLSVLPGGAAEPARGECLETLPDFLQAVETFVCRYVAFPSEHEPVAVALWIAHAHVVERFETSPILAVTSAEMRSGKTRLLDVLDLLAPQPFRVITPSEAVIYTILASRPRPSLLLDEVDAIFGPRSAERYEGLRAILNSGNRQGTPVLRVRMAGSNREVEAFDVYGPKAVAGIGGLPATVADRSIPIRLKRRAPGETVARFRGRTARAEAQSIRFDWSTVGTLDPDVPVPDELHDRAADSWEPLIAIAEAAGGSWPTRARSAAVALSGDEDVAASVGMRLLADIRDVFGDEYHLTTAALLTRLHEIEDGPWGEWFGKPLTGRELAKILTPYGIGPKQKRVRGQKSRGYFRDELTDAWTRYVPPLGDRDKRDKRAANGDDAPLDLDLSRMEPGHVPPSDPAPEHDVPGVPGVPVPGGEADDGPVRQAAVHNLESVLVDLAPEHRVLVEQIEGLGWDVLELAHARGWAWPPTAETMAALATFVEQRKVTT